MKSKIAILLTGLAALLQSATDVHSQQVYPVGNYPAGQAAYQPQQAPVQTYGQPAVYPAQYPVQPAPPPGMQQGIQHWQNGVAPAQYVNPPTPRDLSSIVTAPSLAPAATATQSPVANPPVYQDSGQGCSGDAGCDACDACDSCGSASCACGCGSGHFKNLFRNGFGIGCGDLWDNLCNSCSGCFGIHDNGMPRPSWIWADGEAMLLWTKDSGRLPALATTSEVGTPFDEAGVLGFPTTRVLFGGELDDDADIGYRGMVGVWFNPQQTFGVAGRGFYFDPEGTNLSVRSDGSPILARPFYDVDLNIQDSLVVAFPGFSSGSIDINSSTEMQGYEIFFRKMLYYGYGNRLDFIGGFHSTRIDDSVRISNVIVSEGPDGVVPFGTRLETDDVFKAKNEFYGGEFGLMTQGFDGRLTWNLMSKVSFGSTRETVSIRGQTTTTVPTVGGAVQTTEDFGLLALPSNIGIYEDDEFTIVPELSVNMAYSISSRLQATVGYTIVYWSNVAMASDAISTNINPTQINPPVIGPDLPVYALNDDSFWIQGLTFGLNARF